jgi:two-component sensor histidine kinase
MPLQRAMRGEESHNEEYEMAFADGTAVTLLSNARPVRDARGDILGAVSASLDITALKATERALREAVAQRELLQREADHRIKNSLQLVAGMLRLQRGRLAEPAVASALDEAVSRVNAVAEAHGALQRSPDLRNADAGAMVAKLCRLAGRLNPDVTVSCTQSGDTHLEVDRAVPLGLVVSELLTNALRHPYGPGQAGAVQVRVAGTSEVLEVEVRDDGSGMPAGGGRASSLGGDLVRTLSARIGATVETESAPGQGTTVRLRMPRSLAPAEDAEPQPEPAAS